MPFDFLFVGLMAFSVLCAAAEALFVRAKLAAWRRDEISRSEESIPLLLYGMRKASAFHSVIQLVLIFVSIPISLKANAPRLAHGFWLGFMLALTPIFVILAMMIATGVNRSLVEGEIRGASATPGTYLRRSLLGLGLCLGGQIFLWGAFWVFGKAESALPVFSSLYSAFPYSAAVIGTLIKLTAGLAVFFCFYPVLLRLALPIRQPEDNPHTAKVRETLHRLGLGHARLYTLHYDDMKHFNAFVWTHPFFARWFSPVIAISNGLYEKMTPEEVESVLCHEISHLKLHHVPKRMAGMLLVLAAWLPVRMLIAHYAIFEGSSINEWILTALRPIDIFLPVVALSRMVRVQELQADSYAVFRLGAGAEALKSALDKLYTFNHALKNKRDPGSYFSAASAHPTLAFRQESISHVAERLARGEPMYQWKDYWFGNLQSRNAARVLSAASAKSTAEKAS